MSRLLPLLLLAAAARATDVFPMWWSEPTAPAPELAFDDGSAKPKTIRILRLCPLETTRGRAGELWTLLRKVPAKDDKPASWVPYVQTMVPAGAERVAMLLVPSSPAQALAVEISDRGHAWGSIRLVNLTGGPIEGWFGKRRLNLPHGGQVSSEAATERRTEELVLFARLPDGQQQVLLSSRAILDPERRAVIFLARLANGAVETRALEETKPPAGSAPTGNPLAPGQGPVRPPAAR